MKKLFGKSRILIISSILVFTSLACLLPSISGQEEPAAIPVPTYSPDDTVITITEAQLLSTLMNFSQGENPIKITDPTIQLDDGECHLVANINMQQAANGTMPAVSMHGKVDSRFSIILGPQLQPAVDFHALTLNGIPVPSFLLNALDSMISSAISGQLDLESGSFVLKDINIDNGQMIIRVGNP